MASVPASGGKKSWTQRLGSMLLWGAPLCNVVGGPMLIASSLLPNAISLSNPFKTTPQSQAAPAETPATPSELGEMARLTPEELKATETDLTALKETLKSLGWEICSVGFLGGAISGLAMGYVSKQPGMFMSSFSNIAMVPALLMFPDSFAVKAAVALSTAPWLTGYANIYRNQFRLKPGEKLREFDMAPLFSNEALKKQVRPDGTEMTTAEVAKARAQYSWDMMKFIGQDQVLIGKDIAESAVEATAYGKEFAKNPKEKLQSGAKELGDAYRFIRGKTTEAPEILKPSVFQNQCAAFLLYAGSLPILFLVGSVDAVNMAGKTMFTAGSALANLPMWAVGFNKKDQNLILGIPLMTAGTFTMDTTGGMGVMRLGEAGFMNYIRKEVAKSQQAPQETPSQQPHKLPETETLPEAETLNITPEQAAQHLAQAIREANEKS